MSVNYYDKTTGRVTTVAGGQRIWLGSKAAHDAEALADKLPFNCLMAVIETGLYFRDRNGIETLITSGNGGSSDIQVITMPTANSENEGKVVQYIGVTTADYTHGCFYECISDGGDPAVYSWVWLDVGGDTGGQIQYDTLPTSGEDNLGLILQYTGDTNEYYNNGYFYKCVYDGDTYSWEQIDVQGQSSGQTIQVTSLDTPSGTLLGTVYQYIGDTTADYKHGYFYECILDGAEYKWVNIKVQDGGEDNGLSIVDGKLCITYETT